MIAKVIVLAAVGVVQPVNMKCEMPPMPPPMGCKVAPCVCDKNGGNCVWQFECRGEGYSQQPTLGIPGATQNMLDAAGAETQER
jgi:hypothetical protein